MFDLKLNPKISVIMPVYNAGSYLSQSIESILNQSFSDFEFLIYNDGSTDNSDHIIRSYSDKRIRYTNFEQNRGYVHILNRGLNESKGDYIARMDADDISISTRFEEQIAFLEKKPAVGICGSWFENFGTISGVAKTPILDEDVKLSLFYGTPVGHPTVMMRKSMLEKYNLKYENDYLYSEDYELFERASAHFSILNIPKVLLQYRKHPTQVTNQKWQRQYFLSGKVQARRLLRALNDVDADDIKWMENFFTESSLIDDHWFAQLDLYKNRVLSENQIYPPQMLSSVVEDLFLKQREKTMYSYFFNKYYAKKKYNFGLLLSFMKDKHKPWIFLGGKLSFYFTIKCFFFYHKKDTVSR